MHRGTPEKSGRIAYHRMFIHLLFMYIAICPGQVTMEMQPVTMEKASACAHNVYQALSLLKGPGYRLSLQLMPNLVQNNTDMQGSVLTAQ